MVVAKSMLGGLTIATGDLANGKKLISQIENRKYSLPRIEYNLACSYSMLAKEVNDPDAKEEALTKSIKHLRASYWLTKATRSWARDDRSLDYLNSQKQTIYNEILGIVDTVQKPKTEPIFGPDELFP